MAANIQFVFYKNPKKPNADILVKVLLNEEELRCPFQRPLHLIIIDGVTLRNTILQS